ncbi:glycosyltransferase family 2 protein [Parablautia intestinalis]|uniref:glycosyltransferase family 2 protein n=1 Tax=Parablautia intestinalis TaxID=2320100 RepID=UPI00259C75CF|nr:glycosyltransferase family 2 protein [Parablautia intestinalis]
MNMPKKAKEDKRVVTVSLCMIVKNEEKILARCLDSIGDLADEIIIVDTGSRDRTKEIAARYTDKIYDFQWIRDFAAARNFAFSKAACDYIYSADADEVLDESNREKFRALKENLVPEVEIVQMYYANQLSFGTVYNFDKELRPKLFKRLRTFCWIEPVHETVRLSPVVFDSDIEITHLPQGSHAGRDLEIFYQIAAEGKALSPRLKNMYAKELMISGTAENFQKAERYFTQIADSEDTEPEQMKEAVCVLVKAARIRGDYLKMYRYAMKDIASEGVSEVCFELGEYYFGQKEYQEAAVWYYNAAYETQSILNIHSGGDFPLLRLADCYEKMGMYEQAKGYRQQAREWSRSVKEM